MSANKDVRGAGKDKRAASRGKKVSRTGQGGPEEVDKYIAAAPEPVRSRLKEMRAAIRSAVPAEAVEIISYQIPAFKTKKVLVWYAGFSKHCSLFPTASVIEEFRDGLGDLLCRRGLCSFRLRKHCRRR